MVHQQIDLLFLKENRLLALKLIQVPFTRILVDKIAFLVLICILVALVVSILGFVPEKVPPDVPEVTPPTPPLPRPRHG